MFRANLIFSTALAAFFLSACNSEAIIIPTSADAEIGERPSEDRGNGGGTSMNTRIVFSGDANRNELMVMRFDLTGIDVSSFSDATLNLTHHRNNGSQRPYIVYGVNDGAMGGDNNSMTPGFDDNNWDEGSTVMSTMPGLVYDGDSTTQGINVTDTTNLGGGSFSDALKGDVESISVSGLFDFLANHPDDLVTLIVARDPSIDSSGQDRFATKETTELDSGTPTGVAGDFAPYLELTAIPEPATAALLGMVGLLLTAPRRRRS
jgi:hypothetical protein